MVAKKNILLTLLMVTLVFSAALFGGETLIMKDPVGDDKGAGEYLYPTDPVYKPGSFDITKVVVKDKGSTVEIAISVQATLENPWSMASGFSVQNAFVFIDMDGKANSGHTEGLPGLNLQFDPSNAWDKVVILSPQKKALVVSEAKTKAANLLADIVVPARTKGSGKTISGKVKMSDPGGGDHTKWAYQVVMQSNEGFPGKTDLLTRRVNEFEGQHRFGGGNDGDCDPMLWMY